MNPAIPPQHLTLPVLTERIDEAALEVPGVEPALPEPSPGEVAPEPPAESGEISLAVLQRVIAQEIDAVLGDLLPALAEQVAQRVQARLQGESAEEGREYLPLNEK